MNKYVTASCVLITTIFLMSFAAATVEKKFAFRDDAKCIKCGVCMKNCPVKAISKVEKDGKVVQFVTDPKKCIACGTCIKNCPTKAIAWGQYNTETGVVTPPAVKDTTKAPDVKPAPSAEPKKG